MGMVLVVHHTVSPATAAVYDAAIAGLSVAELSELEIISRPALIAPVAELLAADGVVLLSPVNIGYISGALKHFFDQIYYPALEATKKLPFGAILSSASDASGALRAIDAITTGLAWSAVAPPLVVSGSPDRAAAEAISELTGTVGAYAAGLI